MRISVEAIKFGGNMHSRALGYINNKSAWLSLRKKFQNTPVPLEEGMDAGPSPSKRNSGPSEMLERQSPEKKIEPSGAGQPATMPADKPSEKDQPSRVALNGP